MRQNRNCYLHDDDDIITDDSVVIFPRRSSVISTSSKEGEGEYQNEEDRKEYSRICNDMRTVRKAEIEKKRKKDLDQLAARVAEWDRDVREIQSGIVYKYYFNPSQKLLLTETQQAIKDLSKQIQTTSLQVGFQQNFLGLQNSNVLLQTKISQLKNMNQHLDETQRKAIERGNRVVLAKESSIENSIRLTEQARKTAIQSAESGKIILWFRIRMLLKQLKSETAHDWDWCRRLEGKDAVDNETENKLDMFVLDKRRNDDGTYGYPDHLYTEIENDISKSAKKCSVDRSGVVIYIRAYTLFNKCISYFPGAIVQASPLNRHLYKFLCYYDPHLEPTPTQKSVYNKMEIDPTILNDNICRNVSGEMEEEPKTEKLKTLFFTNTEPLYVNGFEAYRPDQKHVPGRKYISKDTVYLYRRDDRTSRADLLPTSDRSNDDWVILQKATKSFAITNPVGIVTTNLSTTEVKRNLQNKGNNKHKHDKESLFCFNDRVLTQDDSTIQFKQGTAHSVIFRKLQETQAIFYERVMKQLLLSQITKHRNYEFTNNLVFIMYGPSGTGKSYTTEYLVLNAWGQMLQSKSDEEVLCIQSFDFDNEGVHDVFALQPDFSETDGVTVHKFSPHKEEPSKKKIFFPKETDGTLHGFLPFTSVRTTVNSYRGEQFERDLVIISDDKIPSNNFGSVMNWIKLSRNQLPTYRNPNGSSRSHLVYKIFYLPKDSIDTHTQKLKKTSVEADSSLFIVDLAGFENSEDLRQGGGQAYFRNFPKFVEAIRTENKTNSSAYSKNNTDVASEISAQLVHQSEFITDSLNQMNNIVQNTTHKYEGPLRQADGSRNSLDIFTTAMKNFIRRGTIVTLVACLSPSLADYDSTVETLKLMETWQDITTKDK